MPTQGANVATLADVAKTLDPNGSPANIIEMLNQMNRVQDDIMWKEGNLPTGHQTTVRTGLPQSFWRLANQGTTPSKTTEAQFTEQCGMLEQWAEVDKDVAELNGNTAAFRLSRARAGIESMNQEFVQTLFYGNTNVNPEEFLGLGVRYNTLSGNVGKNVLNGGGSGSDNCSVWLIGWGEDKVFGIYPKGSTAGLLHEDIGLATVQTSTDVGGSRLRVYQDRFAWKCGVAVADWRFAVRICNIDVSALVAQSGAANLTELMIKAIHRIPSPDSVRLAFYMNRTCVEMLDIQRRDDVQTGGQLRYADVDGHNTPTFRGIPIRVVDQLVETETAVA